ncbi:MAG: flavin reductase family protein [Longimicrobiales bacterium]|nr:flavin reductase family protein [Longimicrobiales bacterium]
MRRGKKLNEPNGVGPRGPSRSYGVTPPDSGSYRRVIGRFPTGVSVVTTVDRDGDPWGLTANSLTSVSLAPLYLLVCIGRGSSAHDAVVAGEHFAVNLLAADSADLSDRFATISPGARFVDVAWRREITGSPVLERAAAWLDCRVAQLHTAGDHTIVVGEVLGCDADEAVEPLVFHGGRYRALASP